MPSLLFVGRQAGSTQRTCLTAPVMRSDAGRRDQASRYPGGTSVSCGLSSDYHLRRFEGFSREECHRPASWFVRAASTKRQRLIRTRGEVSRLRYQPVSPWQREPNFGEHVVTRRHTKDIANQAIPAVAVAVIPKGSIDISHGWELPFYVQLIVWHIGFPRGVMVGSRSRGAEI